jgi:hypothetical protein
MYRGKKHNVEFLSISALNSELWNTKNYV